LSTVKPCGYTVSVKCVSVWQDLFIYKLCGYLSGVFQITVTMASFQLESPSSFNFSRPEEWGRWVTRFERFRQASGLGTKPEEGQVNTLLYTMGEKSEDIFKAFGLSADDSKIYQVVKEKFDDYFEVRKNIIFERAKFNQRKQNEGETVDSFITALYKLSEDCNYGNFREEMVRDRIVVGLRDPKLSERLQLDPDLTLEKAIAQVRQTEQVHRQQTELRNNFATSGPTTSADAVKAGSNWRHKRPQKQKNTPQQRKFTTGSASRQTECHRCGGNPHPRDKCPAAEEICFKCNRKGHYGQKCLSKNNKVTKNAHCVTEVVDNSAEIPYVFLGSVESDDDGDFRREIFINGTPINCKVDTGADVTVISRDTFERCGFHGPLSPADVKIQAANQLPFRKVLGMVKTTVAYGDRCVSEKVYVVDSIATPLLGKPAIRSLHMVRMVDAISQGALAQKVKEKFPKLFSGLGQLEEEYQIKLLPDAQPHAISAPRRIALPLLPRVKEALDSMVENGVIRKLGPNEPSEWCSGMVVVPKPNGSIRVCVDLTELNKSVVRPRYQLPTVDYTLAQLKGAKVFTKLDANAGFHQVRLSQESQLLTTFLTPFGRFCYTRMPFGISSGPEYFTDQMNQILRETDAHCQMDDVLIATGEGQSHEEALFPVLEKLQDAGVTLNPDKCEFMQPRVTFVGHEISEEGIQAEQRKVQAIVNMDTPTNIHELRRFLGMANQMAKFSPNLADITQPLRELLSKKNSWIWGPAQEAAFRHVKVELSSPTVLAMYDPSRDTKVSADASSYGLGAVLLQKYEEGWRPVYYASRSMTPTERRYAQVEKEALAVTWACDKFAEYLVGLDFIVETDHRPLVALLEKKSLEDVPPRIMRFRLRLMRFRFSVHHIPGKEMYTADTLSRAPQPETGNSETQALQGDVEAYVNSVLSNLPATEERLQEIREAQHDDAICTKIREYTLAGWPERHDVCSSLKPYFPYASEFTVQDGLLMKNDRLVIPVKPCSHKSAPNGGKNSVEIKSQPLVVVGLT